MRSKEDATSPNLGPKTTFQQDIKTTLNQLIAKEPSFVVSVVDDDLQ